MAIFLERVLAMINAVLTPAFDLVAAPLLGLAPLTSLVLIAVATGLAMLWVVARTSDQAGIAAAKRAIHANLFEIRLFNDNLRAVLRALGRVIWHNLRYLRYSLVPLAWVSVPLALVIAQLQAFYGYEGLRVGAPAIVTMRLAGSGAAVQAQRWELEAADGIRVDTPAVVLPGAAEVSWRIVPTRPGMFMVTARQNDLALRKTLDASEGVARRSPSRSSRLADLLLYPSEPPLPPHAAVGEIIVRYPEAAVDIAGLRLHWLLVYVAVSMITAFALAGRLGVTL